MCKRATSLNPLLRDTRHFLMKTSNEELGGPQKGRREKRGKRNWRTEEIHDTGNGKRIFFTWGGTVGFSGTGPKRRPVPEGWSSHSECNPVLPCHLRQEKESCYPDITGSFFQQAYIELNPGENQSFAINIRCWVRLQPGLHLSTALQLYHLPPLLPPPVSNSSCLITWCQPLYASCCTALLYFSR